MAKPDNTQFYNPVKFSVYRNAAYTTTATTNIPMPFDTKLFDTSSNVDIVTNKGRFTVPVSGFYLFTGGVAVQSATSRIIAMLWKNGAEVVRMCDNASSGAGPLMASGSAYVQLTAGDYVELYYYMANGVALSTGNLLTYFTGKLDSTT